MRDVAPDPRRAPCYARTMRLPRITPRQAYFLGSAAFIALALLWRLFLYSPTS